MRKLAQENSSAMDAATIEYDAGGNLRSVLEAFVDSTNYGADDSVADAIVDSVGHASNTVYNVGLLLENIGREVNELHNLLHAVITRPLKEVIEEDGE